MFGLRQKLIIGLGGLLAVLLTISGLGVAVTQIHRNELDTFLKENYASVMYGQRMISAVETLSDAARASTGPMNAQTDSLKQFDVNLLAEDNNITLHPQEDEFAGKLTHLWLGDHSSVPYSASDLSRNEGLRGDFVRLSDPNSTPEVRTQATANIEKHWTKAKQLAQQIINLNLDNMQPLNSRVKAMGDRASGWMVVLSVAGAVLGTLFTLIVARSILQPIQALTRSAREIEQGNLDLVVQVKSRDELHQLAEAFNSMAATLREFRRTDRAKLVRTQRTTQLAVDSMPDAIAIVNQDGTIELSNNTAQKLFSLIPGKAVTDIREHRIGEIYREVAVEQRPWQARGYESVIEVYDQGGQLKYFLPQAVPIVDGDDKRFIGVTLTLSDVTNLRRLDEMKSGLLSVVSHELKTPLTSIRMAAHLLLEERVGPLNKKQTELLMASRDDADRLHRIIENLLDMGRLESGRGELDLRPESAEKLLSESVEPMHASFRDRGIDLTTHVAADVPQVLVDRTRIAHVFNNLLGNALKYTPPGGAVQVSAEPGDEGFVKITIADNGCGIPAEHLSHVFERFFRVPGQSSESGAGLGLAIARDIVEAHGGRISVESGAGAGAKFTFTLRAQRAGNLAVQHLADRSDEGAAVGSA